MSATLQLAATKWARAVRERMAATADLRKARLEDKAGIRPDRTWPASQRVTAARKVERKTEKALLSVVERITSASGSVMDASEVVDLDAPYSRLLPTSGRAGRMSGVETTHSRVWPDHDVST